MFLGPTALGTETRPTDDTADKFEVPEGFEVTLAANDEIAHDIFSMTLDDLGRPVVSGPGYIKTLIDKDRDGRFESGVVWAALPKQGAQGLWREGNELYWVGDGGLWKSVDANGDLMGDGQPMRVLNLPTGGEHDAHAIRRGPDGYWYLTAGNFAKGIAALANDQAAPVQKPRAGTIWRISPDFKTRGVWCHGLRNIYDFDFLPNGLIATYDSDDERDMTLPWYRPTRVMLLTPGSDAGWVGDAWKDPDHRVTMPKVLANLGRGSPTGVAVYRHRAFPAKYAGAILALDWTFGRILAVYPEQYSPKADESEQREWRLGAETFLQAQGSAGFAPTDICIEPDGSLLVCVGGRGTRGAVYRVKYVGQDAMASPTLFAADPSSASPSQEAAPAPTPLSKEYVDALTQIVYAPCPLESWSTVQWRRQLKVLGPGTLASVAIDGLSSPDGQHRLEPAARVGAIQRLVQENVVLATTSIEPLLQSSIPEVQAESWRAIEYGRVAGKPQDLQRWKSLCFTDLPALDSSVDRWNILLKDAVARARTECAGMLRWPVPNLQPQDSSAESPYSLLRQLALWASSRDANAKTSLASIGGALLYGNPPPKVDGKTLDWLASEIAANRIGKTSQELLEIMASIQAALGDTRHLALAQQNTANPTIFDGYVARYVDQLPVKVRDSWSRWLMFIAKESKSRNAIEVSDEAVRTLAMIRPTSPEVIDFGLAMIDEKSHPTQDISVLCALAQCEAKRTAQHSQQTAKALLSIPEKVRLRALTTDNHWIPRISQLVTKLMAVDAGLALAIVRDHSYGKSEHMLFTDSLPSNLQAESQKRFREQLVNLPAKQWSPSVLKYASKQALDREFLNAIRESAKEPAMRSSCVDILARTPTQDDYAIFCEALSSNDRSAWKGAWEGLARLPLLEPKKEILAYMILLARTNGTVTEFNWASFQDRNRKAIAALKMSPPTQNTIAAWREWAKNLYTAQELEPVQSMAASSSQWLEIVRQASQKKGDSARGRLLFAQTKCSQCHGGGSSLGPDLAGISKRFSRDDLFRAIYEPSRDISDRYRALKVLKDTGEIYVGLAVHQSADGLTLQLADGTLERIQEDEIEKKSYASESIMPAGLLDSLNADQIADLYSFLQGL
uniref:Glucose/sorbone dehydrogenase-like protein n=1 Tax=uncultured bacterium A1Q1_fos_1815 TaxID=1256553 RepID=L7VWH0_9BACT|nr:glucose/sorbone dehydrogenase-like protein [uncultured bacterium A1Q1_fos_1815]